MRDPPGAKNACMQLNMGEGKSSVIVAIVAAALADGSQLVRVTVAKPQSRQMLDILVSKLGGLINRQIYQMPLSRSVKLNVAQVQTLANIYRQCVSSGGVMLIQPEHVLSFQLMTVETAIRGEAALAKSLWDMHEMLNSKARDIVDESDENFSTKFELVYTMGDQRSIEHGSERWISLIQEVLGIVAKHSRHTKIRFPRGVELDEVGRSSFPLIRFLNTDAADDILGQSSLSLQARCPWVSDRATGRNDEIVPSRLHPRPQTSHRCVNACGTEPILGKFQEQYPSAPGPFRRWDPRLRFRPETLACKLRT